MVDESGHIHEYLGGGVYIEYCPQEGGFWLKANHHERSTDEVWIDGGTWDALVWWLTKYSNPEINES